MKKAQSISINTIIVAAIALIVLVVIIFVFINYTNIFQLGSKDCYSRPNGVCEEGPRCPDGMIKDVSSTCTDEGDICCFSVNAD